MTDLDRLWPYELRQGNSNDPRHGACTMDAVSWFAYGRLGDRPPCACPILTTFVIHGQDAMPDMIRQRFKAYIFRLMGSRDPGAEPARLRCLVLAATRMFAPMALDAAGLTTEASKLRDLPDSAPLGQMRSAAAARSAATAARAAARAAAAEWAARAAADWAAEAARAATADWAARAAASTAAAAARATMATTAAEAAEWAATAAGAAAATAEWAATAATAASGAVWDAYFETLDEALSLGKQGSLDLDLDHVAVRVNAFAEAARQ